MLEFVLTGIGSFAFGAGICWLYYRDKFAIVLTELEDKKLIIKAIHEHADQIERVNVKQMAKEHNARHNAKVAKKEKPATKKPRKNAVKK
jgi:hypothetical protein